MRAFKSKVWWVGVWWLGVAGLAQAQPLPNEVSLALQQAQLPASALHVVVAPAAGGAPRLSHLANASVNPASLMKLVTTAAAFELLGPNFVWRTPVYIDGPIAQGVLRGNLYIQGQGDPKLVVERLWLLLRRVQAMGIQRIEGDIVLDRSAFDVPAVDPAAFDGDPSRPYNASPDALVVNYKSVLLHWVPDPRQGVARVHTEPPLQGLRMPDSVPLQTGPCIDYRAVLKADFSASEQWVFRGTYPSECGERVWPVAYTDPSRHAARAIGGVWRSIGGQLSGQVRDGQLPPQAQLLLASESPPLAELARDLNKFSNNLMADQVFLTLSWRADGVGRPQASREQLQRWWDRRVGVPGLVVDNGSGLSRTGRVTAQGLATLLQQVWVGPHMAELMSSLPVSGQDGTLKRLKSQAAAHLKTGSLRNVLAVAGYVDAANGQRWVLVAIIEHPQAASGRGVLEALVDWTAKNSLTSR